MYGTPEGNWEHIQEDVIQQMADGLFATFYVSDIDLIDVKISGYVSVQEYNDDDFLGFVFNYSNPITTSENNFYSFYLIDWKSESENIAGLQANEGFRLTKYNGYIERSEHRTYFYDRENNPPIKEIINTSYGDGKGWRHNTEYFIEIHYTQERMEFYVDNELVFDLEECFSPGKFGFYTMSQPNVRFSDFQYEYMPSLYTINNTICQGESISLYLYPPSCGLLPDYISSVTWEFGDGTSGNSLNPTHYFNTAGEYDIQSTVFMDNGCSKTLATNLIVIEQPIINIGDYIRVIECSDITIQSGIENVSYLWSTGETTPNITLNSIQNDTIIWLAVNNSGCKASDTVHIEVEIDRKELYFPNAFSPNGDGLNDEFEVIGDIESLINFNIIVFNRWGQAVFESTNVNNCWNGNYNRTKCPAGTYVFKANYSFEICNIKKSYVKNGLISLVR
jgi:gliding motility-associated-like protein